MPNSHSRKQVRSKTNGSGLPAPADGQTPILPPNLLPKTPQTARALLSRAEVARQLGVCAHTIQRMERRGLIHGLRFNARLIRYSPEVVEEYIRAAATK